MVPVANRLIQLGQFGFVGPNDLDCPNGELAGERRLHG